MWWHTSEMTLSLCVFPGSRLSMKSSNCGVERAMWLIFTRLEPPMPCCPAGCWMGGWGCAGTATCCGHMVGGTGWATGRRWDLTFIRGGGGRGGGTMLASLKRRGSFCINTLWAVITEGISLPCWSTLTPAVVWERGPLTATTDSRLLEIPKQTGKSCEAIPKTMFILSCGAGESNPNTYRSRI